ncbi:bifunctional methylenetetrahydrofolate dehydrogenase/methenyltetrahydrofolate cyclohydrolase [Vibrio sp. Of7-15]|uniref:bifunctional methylenetetrahydrofolate dehydrogenase/methenyltetrahydrofolate cyclohydrolase n=1 Tax=Vibrio sp. Of7-15 TaxID=2724879 RepID=UPI001EF1B88D|nr:bifunctional methylenetetrahydrofolate dehydrogenase/methenyltetrahydrofolate cyclohydrolase [Vibrio sp. Of7-15]MCG7495382.1 bifunctional methylenetetrahydrofolate dehydrogenase/methenyltetrahydrofolate cyclohydrolase [Vibrio sp. Of7-15]
MSFILNPADVASQFQQDIRSEISTLPEPLKIIGFLSTDNGPSHTYAQYTKQACEEIGIEFELCTLPKEDLEAAILVANEDESVHGIFVYYPVFTGEKDERIRNQVDPTKDVEGLCQHWTHKLYTNDRCVSHDHEDTRKAILPCTPLAMIKLLEAVGAYDNSVSAPLNGKVVSIFNRSEVVGRPLAAMLSNDGAQVYSFDENGAQLIEGENAKDIKISREEALSLSDIVITGVPSNEFPQIHASELKPGVIAFNFSSCTNLADDVTDFADKTILRIGPVTVTMCMRNALRLYRNFHSNRALNTSE